MRRIAIVGAGQSGLQLGLALLQAGYHVTMISNRSADDIAQGRVMSSQCMFHQSLQIERSLGLNAWDVECPPVEGIGLSVPHPQQRGARAIQWAARLEQPAQSVDQRVKIPRWMSEFTQRGGELVLREATLDDLEGYARSHDLVIVASGKGEISRLFRTDVRKTMYTQPQRALALTYVRGMRPREPYSAVCFNLIPGVGEYFVFPALTTSGACEIMVFEGVPGGPMDTWANAKTPEQHLALSRSILDTFLPWEAERCRDIALTDDNGILAGRFAPTVRHPIGVLPSGARVLGMADALVLNDPITGQGSNNAAKCADIYLHSIRAREARPFDADWMQQTFDHYWRSYAQWVVWWTNTMLRAPADHALMLLDAAQRMPALASVFANGFDDPRTFYPWFFDAREAERVVGISDAQAA